ncbi:MAG: type II toxin-antitoxin system PemK/MazF family toxin [Calditrichaeota bacterium]|nr:MAG: type II toxin-antitoxin system PemK/MazF family toxin [Calditrichota bacterium]
MERGEIRWFTFKQPDKRRPVLILTRNSALQFLGETTVAPITSTIRDIPTEVILNEMDGLKQMSAVNLDHIQTVSKQKIGRYIAKLSPAKMVQVRDALLFAYGFDD